MERRQWEDHWEKTRKSSFMRTRHDMRIFEPLVKLALDLECKNMIDAGCASAVFYPFLKGKIEYTGIDITPKFVELANQDYPEIKVIEGSIVDMPFDNAEFELCFCNGVLSHMHPDDFISTLTELVRVAEKFVIIGWLHYPSKDPKMIRDSLISTSHDIDDFMEFLDSHPRIESHEQVHVVGRWWASIIKLRENM